MRFNSSLQGIITQNTCNCQASAILERYTLRNETDRLSKAREVKDIKLLRGLLCS